MTSKLLKGIIRQSREQRKINARQAILHHLARVGGRVFGQIPNNGRREFFCLDSKTWVWHEEWQDAQGIHRATTTRYDVRPTGILKSQGNNSYQRLSHQEERNFRLATEEYYKRATVELNRLVTNT